MFKCPMLRIMHHFQPWIVFFFIIIKTQAIECFWYQNMQYISAYLSCLFIYFFILINLLYTECVDMMEFLSSFRVQAVDMIKYLLMNLNDCVIMILFYNFFFLFYIYMKRYFMNERHGKYLLQRCLIFKIILRCALFNILSLFLLYFNWDWF